MKEGTRITFSIHNARKLARGAIVVATAVALAGPAVAAKGGNGNANGNRANAQSQNAEKGNNGRGAIASELKGLNAAHANISGMMNADPDSQVGQIYAYQQAIVAAKEAGGDLDYWGNLYEELGETDANSYGADAYTTALLDQATIVEYYEAMILGLGEGETLSTEDQAAYDAALAEVTRLSSLSEEDYAAEFGGLYDAALQEAETYYSATLITDGLSEDALNEFLRLLGLLE